MNRIGWLFALVVVLVSGLAVADDDTEIQRSISGTIDIDPDGSVVGYRLATEVTGGLLEVIDAQLRGWHFEPVMVDGRAVPATTRMHFTIKADQTAEGRHVLHFGKPVFGAPSVVDRSRIGRGAIQYPQRLVEYGVGGLVLLAARINADGQVAEIHAYQTSLYVRADNEQLAQQWREQLQQAAMRAVIHWRYELGETIAGEPVPATAIIPIDFVATRSRRRVKSGWDSLVPGPVTPTPWQAKVLADLDPKTLKGGVAVPIDPLARLRLDDGEG